MNTATADPFEKMIRDAGEGRLIDWYRPSDRALSHLRTVLAGADNDSRALFGDEAARITPESLIAMYEQNPHKVRAFLQKAPLMAFTHLTSRVEFTIGDAGRIPNHFIRS